MQFDFSVVMRNLPLLWEGMQLSLALTAISIAGGLAVGTLLALARISAFKPLSLAAMAYINLFRSIPLVLAVFWFYFMVPVLVGRPIGAFYSVALSFVFFEGAYFAEIIRAGIQSIRRGQIQAAQATGLTYSQTFRYIVLPQAFRNVAPILLTRCIMIFQDTSLAYVVSLMDFMTATSIVANRDGRPIEMFLFAAAVYFSVCSIANQFVQTVRRTKTA